MKIAICDDDALCREQVNELLQAYGAQQLHQALSVSVFDHAEELLETAHRLGGFDLYLLDILMPGMNGIALGKQLRDAGLDGKIIYLTSSREYAVDAFSVHAFHYLLKPVAQDALFSALDQALAAISSRREKGLIVKTNDCVIRLPFDSILYAALNRRTVVYHLVNGRTLESRQIRTTFSEAVQELLRDGRFVLCGASVAANLHQIVMVEKDALLFKDGSKVYIPLKVCSEVRSKWSHFWFEKEVHS